MHANFAITDKSSIPLILTTIALVLPPALYSTFTVKPGGGRGLGEMVLSYCRVIAAGRITYFVRRLSLFPTQDTFIHLIYNEYKDGLHTIAVANCFLV